MYRERAHHGCRNTGKEVAMNMSLLIFLFLFFVSCAIFLSFRFIPRTKYKDEVIDDQKGRVYKLAIYVSGSCQNPSWSPASRGLTGPIRLFLTTAVTTEFPPFHRTGKELRLNHIWATLMVRRALLS